MEARERRSTRRFRWLVVLALATATMLGPGSHEVTVAAKTAGSTTLLPVFVDRARLPSSPLTVASTEAARMPVANYESGFQVVNLDSNPATVSIIYYKNGAAGRNAQASTRTLEAGQGVTINPADDVKGKRFVGSAVISSDKMIAASALLTWRQGGVRQAAGYSGISGTSASQIFEPSYRTGPLQGGNQTTFLCIQNAENGASTVSVQYLDASGSSAGSDTVRVKPLGSKCVVVDPRNTPAPSFIGSAFVNTSGGGDIAVTVNQYSGTSLASRDAFSAFDPSAGGTTLYAPAVYRQHHGFNTGFNVQNAGSAPVDLQIAWYQTGSGTPVATEQRDFVQAGQSVSFRAEDTSGLGSDFVGAARVTVVGGGPSNLLGVVNQLSGDQVAGAYNAFSEAGGIAKGQTGAIVSPLARGQSGFSGTEVGVNVMNVGNGAAKIDVECSDDDSSVTRARKIPRNSNEVINLGSGFDGSTVCTIDTAKGNVIAIVTEVAPRVSNIYQSVILKR